jgi:PKD repeat protein
LVLAVLASMIPVSAPAAQAAAGDIGFRGPSTLGIGGSSPTGSKPESKLWWNDGSWWANLFDTVSGENHIFELMTATQTWRDTAVRVDERKGTRADTLWDGSHLYVATHQFSTTAGNGFASRLYRYRYDKPSRSYALDPGFPVSINNYKTESLVIDKDSTGKLWATWTQNNEVWANATGSGGDASWGTPFRLPVAGATGLNSDDISSLVAFGGNKIGLMWSNQTTSVMYFAEHVDGQPTDAWSTSRAALQGPGNADDHINLQADKSGRLFAAVKTSLTSAQEPLNMLLVRDMATGEWDSHVFGRVIDGHTRPILVLDETNSMIHMFATSRQSGGTIYKKSTPMDNISFSTGLGEPFIRDGASSDMNDATTSKQSMSSVTGILVLASNKTTDRYWHNYLPIPGPPPPGSAADFAGTPTSGQAPLVVQLTDASSGTPTAWSWSFGDGTTSTSQNPAHTYQAPGSYTVSLTVTDQGGATSTNTLPDFVSVTPPPPRSFSPTADAYVNSSKVGTNFGRATTLKARMSSGTQPSYRSYLRFDTPDLTGPVTSAKLRLRVADSSTNGGGLFLVSSPWTEAGVTWSNSPTLGSQLGSFGSVVAGTWVELALPSSLFSTAAASYSFGLQSTTSYGVSYSSREGVDPPQLVLSTS